MIRLLKALVLAADKTPPTEFQIFPFGKVKTTKGEFSFDRAAGEAIVAEYKARGVDMAGDYDHASVQKQPVPTGAPTPMWYGLELRDDGLWAVDVKWTPRATEYLKGSEYRYYSPAFFSDDDNRITELVNIALTNDPATIKLPALVAASARDRRSSVVALSLSFAQVGDALALALRGKFPDAYPYVCDVYDELVVFSLGQKLLQAPYAVAGNTATIGDAVEVQRTYTPVATGGASGEMNTMKNLLKMLGLSDTATEGEAIIALGNLQRDLAAAQKTTAEGDAQLVQLAEAKTRSDALGTFAAWKSASAQVKTLSSEVAELKSAAQVREVSELVDGGVRDGKVPPAMKEFYSDMGKKDLAMLKAFIEKAPKLVTTPETAKPRKENEAEIVTLSDDEKKIAAELGVDEKKFAENKKRLEAKQAKA